MSKTIIQELADFGQSVWLDYISRPLLDRGELTELITQGLRGLTSNPSIFNKAVSSSHDYDATISALKKSGKSTFETYDEITVKDIQDAADSFHQVWIDTSGLDGYVSLEINPKFAYDTDQTVQEGRRLHRKVNRPNLMLKVPATDQGFPAITVLLSEGINVNTTLIFSLTQYIDTANAYLRGIEQYSQKGGDVRAVSSVASMFVSRIDTSVDSIIEEKISAAHDEDEIARLEPLRGKAAVANSALIYAYYQNMLGSRRFQSLAKKGARSQRVLWGSTSTKNPAYSDIKYVTELIAKGTVNTIPGSTLKAFMDHGKVEEGLSGDVTEAQNMISMLACFDIDLDVVCKKLLDDGVIAFDKAFDSLLTSIEHKAAQT